MKKIDSFEKWAIEHIMDYWINQDEFYNEKSIKLYEKLYKECGKDKKLREILTEGLGDLYAERKQIKHRKVDLRSKTNKQLLRWDRSGVIE